jgi:hypothetical protein
MRTGASNPNDSTFRLGTVPQVIVVTSRTEAQLSRQSCSSERVTHEERQKECTKMNNWRKEQNLSRKA